MNSKEQKARKDAEKVRKVIISCTSISQLEVAYQMVSAFHKRYQKYGTLMKLDKLFTLTCKNLRRKGATSKETK